MIELIPTLFAQQQLKQAATPVQPIEQSAALTQSPTPVVTPASAIATPESVFVSIPATPAPSPIEAAIPTQSTVTATPQPAAITSEVTLPQVPQTVPQLPANTADLQTVDSKSKPVTIKPILTAPAKLTEKPTSRPALPSTTAAIVQRSAPSAAIKPQSTASTPAPNFKPFSSIEIPVPKPTAQSSPQLAPQSPTQQQKQLLEQRLADIVSKDRAIKQAQQRDTLVSRAYSYATQRRFEQARKLLQDPTIPTDVRDQILSNINSLESASRTIGVTQIKEPVVKPTRPTVAVKKQPAILKGITARAPRSQQTVTIQVPRAIDSLPIQRKALTSDPTAPIASDSTGGYIDQMVNPKNLQAYNRNLPKLSSANQILYPLPEPVPVTSGFGWRRHPVTGVRRFHSGVDLGAGQGTPVIASRAGKVTIADRLGGYGLAIVLQQPDGSQDTLYAHLSQIFVRPGEKIKPGTIIGRVGSTGLSTGPHLHYEARRMTNTGWVTVDPGGQLEAARVRLVQARQIEAQPASDRGT